MKVNFRSFLCLVLITSWVFCREAFIKWTRLLVTDYAYGTSTPVDGRLSTAQCLITCSKTTGCVAANVNRESFQCEVSFQHPVYMNNSLTQNLRPGWTVYYRESGLRNCKEVLETGDITTGIKTIYPDGTNLVRVLCVMDEDNGGWTVIQKRESATNFTRSWQEYRDGFGDEINFWIGLENIQQLTSQGNYELRVDMRNMTNARAAAKYQNFSVGTESELYKLTVGAYSYDNAYINPKDSLLIYHNGMNFSTYDRDNAAQCSKSSKGGYWFRACQMSNLNGLYGSTLAHVGLNWKTWTGDFGSLPYTRMMIRPK